ncbi:hypothetical protein AMTR_s00053p00146730 [Amborella trichopoda]|uniref:Uncharacterized protein n=1 Tax=Amborella trichopoda TaxID=13333 RepID=W1PBV6_AMBTC|nr:hypothetical protein AMTR_s00053p00146730 [Amborella trichopoda]
MGCKEEENEWENKYHNKTLPEYSFLSKIDEGNTADGTYKSTGGDIIIKLERPETPFFNDRPVKVQVQSSSSSSDDSISSGSKRRQSHTPIGTQRRSKQPTFNDSTTIVMIEVADSNMMLAREIVAARIFQDSTKAKMLLNLLDPRIRKAYLDEEMRHL